jgi:hypothetical protein
MNGKELLARGIEVVTFLFAMFGGFLTAIAPPEETDAKFAVGISSFFALVVLLFIAVFVKKSRQKKYQKIWLGVAAFAFLLSMPSAFFYKSYLNQLTFPYPPDKIKAEWVRGTELTPLAREYQASLPGITPAELVANFGGMGNRELVWTPNSINRAKLILLVNYTLLVMSLALTIFCLTEGLLRPAPKKGVGT